MCNIRFWSSHVFASPAWSQQGATRKGSNYQGRQTSTSMFNSGIFSTSNIDFVRLVGTHKAQLQDSFGNIYLQVLGEQHKSLVQHIVADPSLKLKLELQNTNMHVFSI